MLRWKLSQFPASRLWQVGYAILILMAACVLQAEPFNTEGRKVLLPVDTQGVGHRFWSNGFLAVREIEKATVHLHNGEGKRLWTVRVTVPESVQTTLYPVTVWPDGSAAAAGGAVSADGARGPFLVLIDPAGKITRMVRTAPFVAQHLTVARDGSLWAFGRILSDWGEKKDKPHMMVRKYSRDGRELAAVLPRDTFPDWPHPAAAPAVMAAMSSWRDRVGLVTRDGEWVEISTETGEQLARRKLAIPNPFRLYGATYGPEGDLYLSGSTRDAAKKEVQVYARVERASGAWNDVTQKANVTPYRGLTIVGSDGDSVVLASGAAEVQFVPFARLR